MKKINYIKGKVKELIKKVKLSQLDKSRILFGYISLILLIFSISYSTCSNYESQYKKEFENYKQEYNIVFEKQIEEIENHYENELEIQTKVITDSFMENNSIDSVDPSKLTKTEIIERKNKLESFLKCFEELGVSEDNQLYQNIISEYDKCWDALDRGNYKYFYTTEDLNLLAYVIMREQGSSFIPKEAKLLAGAVVLNRQAMGGINRTLTNPSIADIINEKGQYPYKSWDMDTSIITDECYECAKMLLERKWTCPSNIVYQSTRKQGSGVYKSFYNGVMNNTTYFCYE